jgi:hypothetical protein
MVALVIDAAPWGRVTRITRAGTQQDLPLEGERHTPYVARLPAGTYEVTVERFGRNLVHSVTIREAADNRVLFEFDGVDVDGYLRRVAS